MLNNTFIISASNNWSLNNPSYCQQLACELAKHHVVLYVNPPCELLTLVQNDKTKKNSKNRALKSVKKNLWVLNPPMVNPCCDVYSDSEVCGYLNKLTSRQYAKIVNWAIASLGLRNSVLINDNDLIRNFYITEYLNPWLSILLYYDPGVAGASVKRLFQRSNVVITSSQNIAEKIRAFNFNTFNIGYGIDFKGQNFLNTSGDIFEGISKPRIGVVAPLDSRELSADLVFQVASQMPECSVVLAGAMDEKFKLSGLKDLPNVYCFDKVDYNYISQIDVCLNPQHYHSLSQNAQKEQILRYLYMGKSVVSTSSLSAGDLAPYIYLASSDNQFIELIKASLQQKLTSKTINVRMKYAQSMSWGSCVNRLYSIINMFETELRESYGKINNRKSLV